MKRFLKAVILPVIILLFTGCGNSENTYNGREDFDEATIGVTMGSTQDKYIEDNYPDARVIRFDQIPDLFLALENKKCDMIALDYSSFAASHGNDTKFSILIPELYSQEMGVGFSYNREDLKNQYNAFLAKIRKDGLYDQIYRRWIDSIDTAEMPDLSSVKRSGDAIRVGCTGSTIPFDFISHGKNAGMDIEIIERFAAYLQRPIEYDIINFGGLIAALSQDMVDLITASITITPERQKKVNFGDSHYSSPACVAVRTENMPNGYSSMKDITTQSIAVLLGSAQDIYITENYPNAEIIRISDNSQLILSVVSGQSEVEIVSEAEAKAACSTNSNLTILESGFSHSELGVAFNNENKELLSQFNSFLDTFKTGSEYRAMMDMLVPGTSAVTPVLKDVPSKKTLIVGTTGTSVPYSLIRDGRPQGIDINLISKFAEISGYNIRFSLMNFESLIPALVSKKIDIAINSIMITPERAKEVSFSHPYLEIPSSAIVLKSKMAPKIVKTAGAFRILVGDGSDVESSVSGAMTGSLGEMYLKDHYLDAEVLCFDDITDAIQSLRTGKVKYVMTSYTNAVNACRTDKHLVILPEQYTNEGAAVAVNKKTGEELLKSINASISKMKNSGMLSEMVDRWIRMDGVYDEVVPSVREDGKILKVGISASREPMCFIKDGKPAGLDCELIQRIAYDMGMKVEFFDMKFSALTAALISNKVDVVISNFTATEERAKVVSFSDEYYTNPQILMTMTQRGSEEVSNLNFFARVKQSFYNNLVSEKRYLLILDGLWQTLIISVFAILLGTLFGAAVCFLRMSRFKALSLFAKGYIDIMRGTPVLVLLMIVFYVIFARSNISATSVAVLTFALNFAAYVSEMFRTSIEGIDRGQKEAGIALGFTPVKTFRYIILPQAVTRVLPVYKGEAISLVKMTSVVGYIAVQDLTKASDIIRSRTFDAFFPLIVITIIYFILAWLLGKGLDLLNKKKTVK